MSEEIPFNKIANYYDLIYQDKNYLKEVEYIKNLIAEFADNKESILELGCGTGKHASLLAEEGYQMSVVDKSSEMIKIAKSRGLENCFLSDIDSFEINKKFDIVLALFHVMSYVTEDQKIDKVLSNIKKHLKSKGVFIFDIWFSPAVLRQKPEIRTKRIIKDNIEILRIAEPFEDFEKNIVDVKYTFFLNDRNNKNKMEFKKESHIMRHFSLPELRQIADKNGFNLLHSEAWLTKESVSDQTWGIMVVLESN